MVLSSKEGGPEENSGTGGTLLGPYYTDLGQQLRHVLAVSAPVGATVLVLVIPKTLVYERIWLMLGKIPNDSPTAMAKMSVPPSPQNSYVENLMPKEMVLEGPLKVIKS